MKTTAFVLCMTSAGTVFAQGPVPFIEPQRAATFPNVYDLFSGDDWDFDTHETLPTEDRIFQHGFNGYLHPGDFDVYAVEYVADTDSYIIGTLPLIPVCPGYVDRELVTAVVGPTQAGYPDIGLPTSAPTDLVLPEGTSVLQVKEHLADPDRNVFSTGDATSYFLPPAVTLSCLFRPVFPDCFPALANVVSFPPGPGATPVDGTYYVVTWEKNGDWVDYLLSHGKSFRDLSDTDLERQQALLPLLRNKKDLHSKSCFVGNN